MWTDVMFDNSVSAFVATTADGQKFVLAAKSWMAAIDEAAAQFDDRELLQDEN